MVLDRLKQLTLQVSASSPPPHPLDPLSTAEIDAAVEIIRKEHGNVNFNAVTLYEPRKEKMMAWLANPESPRPTRAADVVVIAPGGKIYDGVVDLDAKKIVEWKHTPGVQPLITMEDLQEVEHIVRRDPKVIEQCGILGIPPEDMHKVYCDRKSDVHYAPHFSILSLLRILQLRIDINNSQRGLSVTTRDSVPTFVCSRL